MNTKVENTIHVGTAGARCEFYYRKADNLGIFIVCDKVTSGYRHKLIQRGFICKWRSRADASGNVCFHQTKGLQTEDFLDRYGIAFWGYEPDGDTSISEPPICQAFWAVYILSESQCWSMDLVYGIDKKHVELRLKSHDPDVFDLEVYDIDDLQKLESKLVTSLRDKEEDNMVGRSEIPEMFVMQSVDVDLLREQISWLCSLPVSENQQGVLNLCEAILDEVDPVD